MFHKMEKRDIEMGDKEEMETEKRLGNKYVPTTKEMSQDHGSMLHRINQKISNQMDLSEWM